MNIVTTDDDFETKEKSKYIRINLINKGKKTAENCSIKLHIYYEDGILAHEPSNIYPAGYHHAKLKKKLPPLIDIAAGDSQIFDVCSTNNRFGNDRLLRFEDHFTHTRIQARNRPLFIRTYYIKLFVFSDNNSPIEKQYKVYKDSLRKGSDWQKINIKEYNWEKIKKNEARRQRISKWKSKWKSRLGKNTIIKNISKIFKKNLKERKVLKKNSNIKSLESIESQETPFYRMSDNWGVNGLKRKSDDKEDDNYTTGIKGL